MTNDDPPRTPGRPAISDQDVLDAMAHIPGYLDISVKDLRTLYQLTRQQALERAFAHIRADTLMREDSVPVNTDQMLDTAARAMVEQGLKAIPVADPSRQVLGMLSETDFLRRLQAVGFLDLMLQLMHNPTGFSAIGAAFQRCGGRSLPVTDARGRLLGLLLRKDFVAACGPEQPA